MCFSVKRLYSVCNTNALFIDLTPFCDLKICCVTTVIIGMSIPEVAQVPFGNGHLFHKHLCTDWLQMI